jgi:hypothetical protein
MGMEYLYVSCFILDKNVATTGTNIQLTAHGFQGRNCTLCIYMERIDCTDSGCTTIAKFTKATPFTCKAAIVVNVVNTNLISDGHICEWLRQEQEPNLEQQ